MNLRNRKISKNIRAFIAEYGLVITLAVLSAGGIGFSALFSSSASYTAEEAQVATPALEAPEPPRLFRAPELSAQAVYVRDIQSGKVLYEKNGEAQLPLASITKLMTALVAAEVLAENETVHLDEQALSTEGESGLLPFERWEAGELLRYMLVVSSNDGAAALASAASAFPEDAGGSFVEQMNEKAGQLGLAQTYFINPTGLDTGTEVGGGYGSAEDAARLLEYLMREHPGLAAATSYEEAEFSSLDQIPHPAKNTNDALPAIPGLIAGKTGFTDLAGGNLVFAFDAGLAHPIVIAILGSTEAGRFRDAEALVQATLEYYIP